MDKIKSQNFIINVILFVTIVLFIIILVYNIYNIDKRLKLAEVKLEIIDVAIMAFYDAFGYEKGKKDTYDVRVEKLKNIISRFVPLDSQYKNLDINKNVTVCDVINDVYTEKTNDSDILNVCGFQFISSNNDILIKDKSSGLILNLNTEEKFNKLNTEINLLKSSICEYNDLRNCISIIENANVKKSDFDDTVNKLNDIVNTIVAKVGTDIDKIKIIVKRQLDEYTLLENTIYEKLDNYETQIQKIVYDNNELKQNIKSAALSEITQLTTRIDDSVSSIRKDVDLMKIPTRLNCRIKINKNGLYELIYKNINDDINIIVEKEHGRSIFIVRFDKKYINTIPNINFMIFDTQIKNQTILPGVIIIRINEDYCWFRIVNSSNMIDLPFDCIINIEA